MSEQFEKQEPTDIQGLEAVKTTNRNQPLGIKIEQIVSNRCAQSGFLLKIKGNVDAPAIRYRCKVQAPGNKAVSA